MTSFLTYKCADLTEKHNLNPKVSRALHCLKTSGFLNSSNLL